MKSDYIRAKNYGKNKDRRSKYEKFADRGLFRFYETNLARPEVSIDIQVLVLVTTQLAYVSATNSSKPLYKC